MVWSYRVPIQVIEEFERIFWRHPEWLEPPKPDEETDTHTKYYYLRKIKRDRMINRNLRRIEKLYRELVHPKL